jgi:hypothetical protein
MDHETRDEFQHGRESFKLLHAKMDAANRNMADHILEDSKNFGEMIRSIDKIKFGASHHDKESEQRVKTERSKIDNHLQDHKDRKKWVMGIVAGIIIVVIPAAATVIYNTIKAAQHSEQLLQEMKKQNGNGGEP